MKNIMKIALALLLVMGLTGCVKVEVDGGGDLLPIDEQYATIDAYFPHGGMLEMVWDGQETETGSMDFIVVPGQTVKEALTEANIKNLSAYNENDTFEGWLIFNVGIIGDDQGNEEYIYYLASETVYSTEELMELTIPEYMVVYTAKWAGMDLEQYYAEEDYMFDEDTTGVLVLHLTEGEMRFVSTYDKEEYTCDAFAYWMEDKTSVNDLSQTGEWDTFVGVEHASKTFAGWDLYEGTNLAWTSENKVEDGQMIFEYAEYEGFEYVVLDDAFYLTRMTTEDLLSMENSSKAFYAVAVWE